MRRRSFLHASGLALVAAPFLHLLSRPAWGALPDTGGAGGPKRLLVLFSPNGTIHRHWRPSGGERDFTFPAGSVLEALTPYRDSLLVLDGLDFHDADNHEAGMAAMLTNKGTAGSVGGGMSLDQYVASQIGAASRFRSLELGVQTSLWGGITTTRMSYAGPDALVTPDDSPSSVYSRLYGELAGSPEAAARLLTRRQSVLDLLTGELGALSVRLGSAERAKLDAHLESLRAMERALEGAGGCEPPVLGAIDNHNSNANFPAVARAQLELAVQALACDMTRVASVQMSHTISTTVHSWVGASSEHHSLSHVDDGNTSGVAEFIATERWFAEEVAYVLGRLTELPSPDGEGSLLDGTVVLWCKELGDGRAHTCVDVPWVIAGGGGALRTGRYVDLGGLNHAHVLVSICQALGLDLDTFGDPNAGAGPAEALT
ncbi:MAG: DUF1552 domain-containing protein [Pseudomonadota bacterium]|nr:DUF1552 domain-containing protein [Pseudomonadota bacterium]